MDVYAAESAMDMTRDFYAGHGTKSGNKVYAKSKKDVLSEGEFEKRRTSFLVRMFNSGKANRRNGAMKVSQAMRQFNPSGATYYDIGKALWNRGQGGDFVTGNCGEMAAVAAFLLIDQFNVPADQVYIGHVKQPGDHMFCLAGAAKAPPWTAPQEMDTVALAGAHVIDPWLHVACASQSYMEFAGLTLRKWHREGKRVLWHAGPQGKGWYDPSGTYAKAFATAPLVFYRATA